MAPEGAFELAVFGLAYKLRVDVDEVRRWSYDKFNAWLAFFDAKERLTEQERQRGK